METLPAKPDTDLLDPIRYEYIKDPMSSLQALAEARNVPVAVVEAAAREGKWLAQRREHFKERYEGMNTVFREMATERRMPMVLKQLEAIEKLQDKVLDYMDLEGGGATSQDLRRLSETLTSLTGSISALLGVKDAFNAGGNNQGTTNANFFILPGARPIRPVSFSGGLVDVTPE
jgi:hypothetical protein